jgi:hypothetical protein
MAFLQFLWCLSTVKNHISVKSEKICPASGPDLPLKQDDNKRFDILFPDKIYLPGHGKVRGHGPLLPHRHPRRLSWRKKNPFWGIFV